MKCLPKFSAIFLAALLVMGFAGQRALRADNAPPPTRLAVINLVKAFEALTEKTDGDHEIAEIVQKITDERTAREKEVKGLQDELKAYHEGSKEFDDTSEKLMSKSIEYDAFVRFSDQKIMLEQRVRTAAIYRKMNAALSDYSKANGIALVLVQDDMDVNARSQQELLQKITLRKVIYADPSLDITDRLVDKMNDDYKLHGSSH
jgi:Skp family chaperone for outer membrane proteins